MYRFKSNNEEDKGLSVAVDEVGEWTLFHGDVELGHSWISLGYDHTRDTARAIAINVFRTQRKVRADRPVTGSTKEGTDECD